MKRLLAVAVLGDWVGDWYPVRGDEREAVAYPIAEGESVMLEVDHSGGATEFILLRANPRLLEVEGWLRYRVVKKGGGVAEPSHTTVELYTNGKISSRSGDADDSQRTNGVGRDQGT